jgi:hypothetical protein
MPMVSSVASPLALANLDLSTTRATRTLALVSSVVVGRVKWGKYSVRFWAYLDFARVTVHGGVVVMSGYLAGACLPVVDVVAAAVVAAALGAVVVQYVVVVATAVANVLDNRRHVKWVECGAVVDDVAVALVHARADPAVVDPVAARDMSLTGPIEHLVQLRITTRSQPPSNFDLAAFGACAAYLAVAFDHHAGACYDREQIPMFAAPEPAVKRAIRHVYSDMG